MVLQCFSEETFNNDIKGGHKKALANKLHKETAIINR